MSVRLLILGLLRRGPLHGYDIKRHLETHMGDWTAIEFGSIYFALRKLTEEGLLVRTGAARQGNRPVRKMYALAPAGEAEFMDLLEQTWRFVPGLYFDFDIALYFQEALPVEQRLAILEARIQELEAILAELGGRPGPVRAIETVIGEHTSAHYRAELEWTRTLRMRMFAGELEDML